MRTRLVACAALVAAAALAAAASAAGPAPQVLQGEPGIGVAAGAHVVAIAGPSPTTTRVSLVRNRAGKTVRARVLTGKLGVPTVTSTVASTGPNGMRMVEQEKDTSLPTQVVPEFRGSGVPRCQGTCGRTGTL